jgi:hypothetical protein
MDKDKILDDIFSNDPLGLLNVKPKASNVRNADERLLASFQEITNFYEKNKREPEPRQNDISEYQLYTRLKGLRNSEDKMLALESVDKYNLLPTVTKEINSIDDIFGDDSLGIFDDDTGLFDFNHTPKEYDRANTDFVARRKPCKDFDKYKSAFKEVQLDLSNGKRKLVSFTESLLKEGNYYVNNGILLYLESVNYEERAWSRGENEQNRIRKYEDGRTRTIFENGTLSNMLFRSLSKVLSLGGMAITQSMEKENEDFVEKFSAITEKDEEAGYIYVLKSKSRDEKITSIENLYKIGFSKFDVQDRIKNAEHEPTYLMAPVEVEGEWKCYNMNPHKFEQLLHNFFGKSCLEIDVFDAKGRRHTPREWFIVPIEVIEQAIPLITSGEIIHYRYDNENMVIVRK